MILSAGDAFGLLTQGSPTSLLPMKPAALVRRKMFANNGGASSNPENFAGKSTKGG